MKNLDLIYDDIKKKKYILKVYKILILANCIIIPFLIVLLTVSLILSEKFVVMGVIYAVYSFLYFFMWFNILMSNEDLFLIKKTDP